MAQRRMFSKVITNSSRFLMMPQSSQNLYFHLGMNADDDGFCEHFTVMRMTESKPDDLRVLQAKEFIKIFDDKVLVIKDWKENNYLRSDRYTPSKYLEIYKEELKQLSSGKEVVDKMDTKCLPVVDQMDTQDRLGKVRVGKDISSPNGEEAKPADKQYGNPEINECVSFFKAELDGELDDSVAGNRRYAKLLLDKFRKAYPDTAPVDNVQALIRAARNDKFHKRNATSFKYLYYNAQKIIQAKKSCAGNVAII